MKRKNFVLASVMALAITGGSYGVAFAQDNPTPECGAALSTLVDARSDLNAAPKEVANPDLAKLKSDVASHLSNANRADARATQQKGIADAADTAAATAQEAAKAADAIDPAIPRSIAERDKQRGIVTAKLAERDLARSELTKALAIRDSERVKQADAQKALDAAPANVPNPDLKNLQDKAAKAQSDADKACQGQKGDPGPVVVVPPAQNPPAANPPVVDDKDCKDFATQSDAQKALTEGDPFNLDSDKDGQACEEFFTPNPPTANQPQVQQVPVGGVETGDGSLA